MGLRSSENVIGADTRADTGTGRREQMEREDDKNTWNNTKVRQDSLKLGNDRGEGGGWSHMW